LIGAKGAAIVRPNGAPTRQKGPIMTQSNNRILDEIARMMTDAAGAAQGVKREVETLVRSQGEKLLRDMDVVSREEFEAVKAMAEKARAENDRLTARIAALEARLGVSG
jgi:BMFP domain-containing protein YqiC